MFFPIVWAQNFWEIRLEVEWDRLSKIHINIYTIYTKFFRYGNLYPYIKCIFHPTRWNNIPLCCWLIFGWNIQHLHCILYRDSSKSVPNGIAKFNDNKFVKYHWYEHSLDSLCWYFTLTRTMTSFRILRGMGGKKEE